MSLRYLDYFNPIHIIWRKGTEDDPYIEKVEFLKVVNQKVVLSEIPDKFNKVKISGLIEVNYDDLNNKKLNPNEYYVDYSNGVIQLHNDKEGTTVSVTYVGRGLIQYPSTRIYHYDSKNNIVESLNEIIDKSKNSVSNAEEKILDLEKLEDDVTQATNKANTAADNAFSSANKANNATDLALDAYNTTRLVFKPYVNTFNDLETTYPEPQVGWTVQVYDTGIRYRFDGSDWIPIDLFGGSVPLANENIDGLLSKEDYIKLQELDTQSNEKVIVFVIPEFVGNGIQNVYPLFPYDGEIIEIKAICSQKGHSDAVIRIEKSSDMMNWNNILSQPVTIPSDSYFDDQSHVLLNNLINKNEILRLNVIQSGGIFNLSLEIKIKLK